MDSPYTPQPSSDQAPLAAAPTRVFNHRRNSQTVAVLQLVGGVLLCLFALGMFVLNIIILNPSAFGLHATTTLPTIMGVFLLSAAVASLRSPGSVELTDEAILLHPSQRILWQEIAFASVDETAGGHQKQLRLLNPNGKKLAQIAGSIEKFDELVAQVREKVGQHTAPEVTSKVQMQKARKQAVLSAAGALALLTAGVFLILESRWTRRAEELMQTAAVDGQGIVTDRFVAPNGTTTRIRYTVTGDRRQEAEHNVEVSRDVYDAIAVGDSVAVRYVPSDPSISRLASGEIEGRQLQDSPTVSFIMGAAASVMALFLAAAAVMFWKGYDFKIDHEGARFVPLGT